MTRVGPCPSKPPRERLHQPRGQFSQRLVVAHHAQVIVETELEPLSKRRQEIAMLPRAQHVDVETGVRAQGTNYRRHLDDFRPRADDANDIFCHAKLQAGRRAGCRRRMSGSL